MGAMKATGNLGHFKETRLKLIVGVRRFTPFSI
jgi:hypothetical protein